MTHSDLITIRAAADLAGVAVRTIHNWIAQDKLTKYQNALGDVRVSRSELEGLLEFAEVRV